MKRHPLYDLQETLDNLIENLGSLRDELKNIPNKKYVRVKYIDCRPGYNPGANHIYEDPWGDLVRGEIVGRPSGMCRVIEIDVPQPLQASPPLKLTERWFRKVQ